MSLRMSEQELQEYYKRTGQLHNIKPVAMEKIAPREQPKKEKIAARPEIKKEYPSKEGTQCWEDTIIIEVPGRAVPAVRMTTKGKFIKENAQRYLAYKDQIGILANMLIGTPTIKYVIVDVKIYLYGKFKEMGMDGDIDNYLKSAMDGLKGVAYIDDRQVAKGSAMKIPCKHEKDQRMVIEIREMKGWG